MKRTKRTKRKGMRLICAVLAALLVLSLCGCAGEEEGMYSKIQRVRDNFASELGTVTLYHSGAEEWEDGYIDQGFVAALLGEDGVYPAEMAGVGEYAFLISSQISLCEVWAVECRTYVYARAVYDLLERRKHHLTAPDYESESDARAAEGAALLRDGRYVYFAVCGKGADIVEYLAS